MTALAIFLSGCGEPSLSLPQDNVSSLLRGCESKPPTGECAPAGIILHYRKEF